MPVLIWSLAFVGMAFVLHVVLWRIRPPKRHTRTLALLFVGASALGLTTLALAGSAGYPEWLWPNHPAQYLHIGLFVMAFAAAYIITYSAVEVDSPSLVMIMSVDQAGAEGLPKVDFHRRMNDDVLVRPRLRDMLRDGLAVREDGRYRLTAKGRRSIRVFVLFRRLMRLSKGG